MKRTIALVLALAVAFTLAGCARTQDGQASGGDAQTQTSSHSVNIGYYAKIGQIPELPIRLGQPPEEVKSYYETLFEQQASDPQHAHDEYMEVMELQRDGYTSLQVGTAQYMYRDGKENAGIGMIASFDTSYGFDVAVAMPEDVKNALSEYTAAEFTPTEEDLFFLPATDFSGFKCLSYHLDDCQLNFYFESGGFLSCATLIDTVRWGV